ncbi:hypothetical protein [Desulfoferula mesophila]|uniref:Uncharacterized protein n=1 Tax=Desulfoferula mesophila TaxID=3058419 RepID=A0AAU9F3M8_9BACT|nr:hypothetical protein FAK_23780 [Desulfoferula mesophilus]
MRQRNLYYEENILAEGGCRDALVVWQHGGDEILLDGKKERT